MDEIMKKTPGSIDLRNNEKQGTSLYEEIDPIKVFGNALKKKLDQAQSIANEIYGIVLKESAALSSMGDDTEKGFQFVLDLEESAVKAIDRGDIKLVTTKTGEMIAQFREPNGHFGKKIPIKKEYLSAGLDPMHAMTTLQLNALQDQLEKVAAQINNIEKSVYEVLQGLQNDRIGQFYSGIALYTEAMSILDEDLRKYILSQALKSLTDASFQLKLSLQTDIAYLENKAYRGFKGKQVEKIDERMKNIHQSFAVIHQATMMKAGIYCELGEIEAMTSVLNEYSSFINSVIVKNSRIVLVREY